MASALPRHELKYLISAQDSAVLKSRLSGLLRDDAHGDGAAGYTVTSLYFDSPYRRFAAEKEAGIGDRVKYRIRTYGTDGRVFRFEKKVRKGEISIKTSCPVDPDFAMRGGICDSDAAGTDESTDRNLLLRFCADRRAGLLTPAVTVRYRRRAFYGEPGRLRITFDEDVCAIPPRPAFHPRDGYSVPVLPDRSVILEVKFDDFLPDAVRSLLQLPGRPAMSLSKYMLCIRALPFIR